MPVTSLTTAADGGLSWFNALPVDQAASTLNTCLGVDRWVATIAGHRPYPGRADLVDLAVATAQELTGPEIAAALAGHPRLGEQPGATVSDAVASAAEQSGLRAAEPAVATALRAGNAAYQQRFGRIFVMAVAGRDATDVLAAMNRRLRNDPVAERAVVIDELGAIAVHRLTTALDRHAADPPADPPPGQTPAIHLMPGPTA
jgi:2-oxo-4-hydroxy-4-carboxy-5-ureidoimidazoline decarboxylase